MLLSFQRPCQEFPPRRLPAALWVPALTVIFSCAVPEEEPAPEEEIEIATQQPAAVFFVDATAGSGLEAFHQTSGEADKMYIPASTGAGVALFDYDADGDLDVFLVNGSRVGGFEPGEAPTNRLFRQDSDRFRDVTEVSGLSSRGAWGQGCAVADVDGNGFPDLYVTNYRENALYLNRGDGTFAEKARQSGVDDPRWSTGAAFLDPDRDGDLDLYVANYIRFDQVIEANRGGDWISSLWKGLTVMSGPLGLPAAADAFFRHGGLDANGLPRYTEVTAEVGLADAKPSYGFQPTLGDYDRDGFVDLFVPNDSQSNFLWRNLEGRGFRDVALEVGVALNRVGKDQASMGVTFEDHNGDGWLDLFITNFADDTNTLYVGDPSGFFDDATHFSGLENVAVRNSLAWGTFFFDAEHDGDLDLFVANGHVYPQIDQLLDPSQSYAQLNQLFLANPTGRFAEATASSGPGFRVKKVSRGAAMGDLDNDGDLDIVINNLDATPTLLRNESRIPGHWVQVLLQGRDLNRSAIGARIEIEVGDKTQSRTLRSSDSFLSHHDPRTHFGLGMEDSIERLTIAWPDGSTTVLSDIPVDSLVVIHQETGLVSADRR